MLSCCWHVSILLMIPVQPRGCDLTKDVSRKSTERQKPLSTEQLLHLCSTRRNQIHVRHDHSYWLTVLVAWLQGQLQLSAVAAVASSPFKHQTNLTWAGCQTDRKYHLAHLGFILPCPISLCLALPSLPSALIASLSLSLSLSLSCFVVELGYKTADCDLGGELTKQQTPTAVERGSQGVPPPPTALL